MSSVSVALILSSSVALDLCVILNLLEMKQKAERGRETRYLNIYVKNIYLFRGKTVTVTGVIVTGVI